MEGRWRSPVTRMSAATCGNRRPGCCDQAVAHPGVRLLLRARSTKNQQHRQLFDIEHKPLFTTT